MWNERSRIQVIANLAVVVGLLALVFQLYQDHKLQRAELIWQHLDSQIGEQLVLMGENPMPILVKAAQDPGNLTDEEAAVVIAYSSLILTKVARGNHMEKLGLFSPAWRAGGLIDHELGSPVSNAFISDNIQYLTVSDQLKNKLRKELESERSRESFATLLRKYNGKTP